jgi:hypothetical protein
MNRRVRVTSLVNNICFDSLVTVEIGGTEVGARSELRVIFVPSAESNERKD